MPSMMHFLAAAAQFDKMKDFFFFEIITYINLLCLDSKCI